MLETKLLVNSVIYDAKDGALFMSVDLKDFFLKYSCIVFSLNLNGISVGSLNDSMKLGGTCAIIICSDMVLSLLNLYA